MTDTLHIGSNVNELLCVKSSKVVITIIGKASHPKSNTNSDRNLSSISIQSVEDDFSAYIFNDNFCRIRNENSQAILNIKPMFFEQRDYEILIEFDKDIDVEFWHENINIRNKVIRSGKKHPVLSGVINFRNEIGYSDIEVLVNGRTHLKITLEVFPSKLNYQEDYQLLLQDVTDEVYNLAYDFLKKTYQQADFVQKSGNSVTEFWSIINLIFKKLLVAADIVIAHPYHELQSVSEVVIAHKIKRVDNSTLKWINSHPQYTKRNGNDKLRVEKAMTTKKQISFDTQENRFVKFVLLSTMRKLESMKTRYNKATSYNKTRDGAIILRIEAMKKELAKRVDYTFLKDVGTFNTNHSMSLIFAMAPGYKELYRYYLMLQKGLSLHGSVFNISVKDMAQLYEYWCFIKLNSILRDQYTLIKQDILKTDKSGLFVTLKKGQKSVVEYQNSKNGELISLSYNQGYSANDNNMPTVSQKPDNVLSLIKSKGKYEYIFDAKYRINMSQVGSDYYNRISHDPGPEESDINTMHRYRDAIVYKNKGTESYERSMFGAYILFPYNNEESYKDHRFYKSIEKVNVGGLPFLPGATKLVEGFLDELILDSASSAFDRATLPRGIEDKLEHVNLKERNVLVGLLKNSEQLERCLKNKIYHIPVKSISEDRFPFEYIAIHQTKELFGEDAGILYYGKIRKYSKMKRAEIIEFPVKNKSREEEQYYYFEIVEWMQLNHKIEVDRMRRSYYTNIHLLHNCRYRQELSLTSMEQLRLYTELKRLSGFVRIMDLNNIVKHFEFNGRKISFDGDIISIYSNDRKTKEYPASYLTKSLKAAFNEIKLDLGCK